VYQNRFLFNGKRGAPFCRIAQGQVYVAVSYRATADGAPPARNTVAGFMPTGKLKIIQ
jgi:hypothetical protein